MMDIHGTILLGLYRFILGVFIVEALLKVAAYGRKPWRYFADGWNVFDFLMVVLCLLPEGGPLTASPIDLSGLPGADFAVMA